MTKKQIRNQILNQRNTLTNEQVSEASGQIYEALLRSEQYCQATDLCLYVPIKNEIDLFRFAEVFAAYGKKIWLPRVQDMKMDFFSYEVGITKLAEGAYHIPEPQSDTILIPEQAEGKCLVVMPGAAFTKERDRIGYGGGYYDRYLARHTCCITVAVCYSFQIVPKLPREETDMKPQYLLVSDISDYNNKIM